MSFRKNAATKVSIDGRPYTVFVVDNPTIEDVMVVEMKIAAADIANGTSDETRRVSRDVRDALIRLGVER